MNASQEYPLECDEDLLKQTMLDHEIIFKKQVQELHRLYAVQKSLMKGDAKYIPMKRIFTESYTVGSTRFLLDDSFLQEDRDFCARIHQRPLDLRLSTGNFYDDDVLDDEEVNLSLSIGRSTSKRSRIAGKTWKNKIVYPLSRDIIDLEESTDYLKLYSSLGTKECFMNGGNLHQGHLKIDPSCRKTESSMNFGVYQDWSLFNQGSNERHDVKQNPRMDLDLNKDQTDESSFHSNELLEPFPSSGSSSSTESCSRIDKPIRVSTSTPLTLKEPESQIDAEDLRTKACTIALESIPEPSSNLTEEKDMHIEVREEKEKDELDYAAQKAALSLISISLQQTSTSDQDSETRSGSNEIENDNENKKIIPQSSSIDSYESLVLKLEESSIDEDSVTSKAYETAEFDKKEHGIKLRRGRRLKDFQKDILPTLSSLSRHEIWEDINILEGVIRSREYKRLHKAKTGNGENWFVPVRSKRSKVNYTDRK